MPTLGTMLFVVPTLGTMLLLSCYHKNWTLVYVSEKIKIVNLVGLSRCSVGGQLSNLHVT